MSRDLRPISKIIVAIGLIVVCLVCVIPIITVISISFSTDMTLTKEGYGLLPKDFTLDAYKYVLKDWEELINAYFVSIATTVVGTLVGVILNALVAYVLSREGFRFQKSLTVFYLFPMLFSGGLVASYIWLTKYLHMKDTFLVLIIGGLVSPWYIVMLRTFFRQLPSSLFEAAVMDGAEEMAIWVKIAVPLAKPAMASIALFTALAHWNNWFTPLMYITDRNLYNLQYKLYMIMKNAQEITRAISMSGMSISLADIPTESMRMALCVVTVVPMMIIFPFFQKYFVKGLTVGGVKG